MSIKTNLANFTMATVLSANIATMGNPIRKEIPESYACPEIIAAQEGTREDVGAVGAAILEPILCDENAPLNPTILKSDNGKLGAVGGFGTMALVYAAMGWRRRRKEEKNNKWRRVTRL